MSKGDNRATSNEPTARLEELKEQIQRASAFIGELREKNYSLTTEIVELKNRLAAGGSDREVPSPRMPAKEDVTASGSDSDPDSKDNGLAEEIELLRSERETVRKKLKSLIARIEKLES